MSSDSFWHRIGRQLATPEGRGGRLIGRLMVWLNRTPNHRAIDELAPRPQESILEVGFGPGDGLREILRCAPGCQLAGIDKSAQMRTMAGKRNRRALAEGMLDLRVGSTESLPWPDATFDAILAVNIAYFFDEAGITMREFARVLKPGGRLVLYVTDRETMRRWPFAGPQTHRTFDRPALEVMLAQGAFPTEGIAINALHLPMGMRGWIAVAHTAPAPVEHSMA